MAIDLIVFGLDNTLFDTESAHLQSSNQTFEKNGLSFRWSAGQYRSAALDHGASGAIASVVEKIGFPRGGPDAVALHDEMVRLFHEHACGGRIALRAGCADLINEALDDGCKLAIVTDLPASTATVLLEQAFGERSTELFASIASEVNFGSSRGNSPYHLVLRTIGADPWRSVAIDSSVPALLAAQRAGLWTLAATPHIDGLEGVAGAECWYPHLRGSGSGDPVADIADAEGGSQMSFQLLDSMQTAARTNPLGAMPDRAAWA